MTDLLRTFGTRRLSKSYAPDRRFLKSVGAAPIAGASPDAILVYPGFDVEGDRLNPEGGNWERFYASPSVNYNHGPQVGIGELVMKSIPDPDNPGERVNVPVGRTIKFFAKAADLNGLKRPRIDRRTGNVIGTYTIDECLRCADEVAPSIFAGETDGLSIEFVPTRFKALGRSPLANRPALDVETYDGFTWAHCHTPMNPGSSLLLDDNDVRLTKAIRWLEKPNLMPFVRDSLKVFVKSFPTPTKRTISVTDPRIRRKALPPAQGQQPAQQPPADDDYPFPAAQGAQPGDPNAQPDVADGAEPVPVAVKALLTLAQAVMDACQAGDDQMAMSDSPTAKSFVQREMAWFQKKCAKLQAYADALGESLKGGGAEPPEPDDDDDAEGDADDPIEKGLEDEADGDEPDGDAEPKEGESAKPKGDGDKPKKGKFPDKPDTDEDGAVKSKSYDFLPPRLEYKRRYVRKSDVGPPVEKPLDDSKLDRLIELLSRRN